MDSMTNKELIDEVTQRLAEDSDSGRQADHNEIIAELDSRITEWEENYREQPE
jgi:predicted transcriptional regulator